jgi:hypothetical protein
MGAVIDKLGMNSSAPARFTDLDPNELRDLIDTIEGEIAQMLAPYEPISATSAWFETVRAIEECINLLFADLDAELEERLIHLPVMNIWHHMEELAGVCAMIADRFGSAFAARFAQLVKQGASIGGAFALHVDTDVPSGFRSVGTMIGYLQSRRRHFVAILHSLPKLCLGRRRVMPLDTLNIMLPVVELRGLLLVGAEQALLVAEARARLKLEADVPLAFPLLDPMFLEPERARITEVPMNEEGVAKLASREPVAPDRLFSAAELRNDILAMEAAYAEFDLTGSDFGQAAAFVRHLSRNFIDRDYWIVIRPRAFDKLAKEIGISPAIRKALIHDEASYAAGLSTYAPLVLIGGFYRSTVTLLSRFMYHQRAVSLDGRKRYQIRAGFIFEHAVAQALERQGFAVQKITRVGRHEFDVVTIRDGTIWNVQCKNNFLDLGKLERDPTRFGRYNRYLALSYSRALAKEQRREQILTDHVGINRIEHMVVSRFPVVTDDVRIVPFSLIDRFAAIADQIAAA